MSTSLYQTTLLMAIGTIVTKHQKMKSRVAVLRAVQCHAAGRRTKAMPRKLNTAKAGLNMASGRSKEESFAGKHCRQLSTVEQQRRREQRGAVSRKLGSA